MTDPETLTRFLHWWLELHARPYTQLENYDTRTERINTGVNEWIRWTTQPTDYDEHNRRIPYPTVHQHLADKP